MADNSITERALSRLPGKFRQGWQLLEECEALGRMVDKEREER